MTKVEFKGLHRVRAGGKVYLYAWRGGPALPGPEGSKAFVDAWRDATSHAPAEGTLKRLVADYRASTNFTGLADSTRKNWTPWLDRISEDLGRLSIKAFDRPEVRKIIKKWRSKWKDAPRQADTGKQVLSAVLSFAVEDGLIGSNPCFGISNLYSTNRASIIWTQEDIDLFARYARQEFVFAIRLACLTGLRESDLIRLEWEHIGDLAITLPSGKSRGRLEYVVPLYDELRALLEEIRAHRAGMKVLPMRRTILLGAKGRPWTSNGFQSAWGDAKAAVRKGDAEAMEGFKLHFHDTRGTAATKFFLIGFTPEEIAEIVAWDKRSVEEIIDRYVRRDVRVKAKIEKMNGR